MVKQLAEDEGNKKRPYVNQVIIKLPKREILSIPKRAKTEYVNHTFLINNSTSFMTLLREACDFW
jgi:hypothetical protein